MTRILLFGSTGMLGREVLRIAEETKFEGTIVTVSHAECDIRDEAQVEKAVAESGAQVVVNCAAYTQVDKAESETETAMEINGKATGNIARAAKRHNMFLIHISTDYVFDGEKEGAYKPEDETNPINEYGRSKLAGEKAIEATTGLRYAIVRTQWLYSHIGKNFFLTMLRLFREWENISVVGDQRGTPTLAAHLAEAIIKIAERRDEVETGIYHYSDSGSCTWYEFASEIAKNDGTKCMIREITTEEYPTPARRPKNSILDKSKTTRITRIALKEWQEGVRECYKKWRDERR